MKRLLIVLVTTLTFATGSCSHIQPVVSCLQSLAGPLLNAAVSEIYSTIEAGLTNGLVEADIIASLEHLAVKFAPDLWACAMHFVATPDNGPNELKMLTPANGNEVAAVAADYLVAKGIR